MKTNQTLTALFAILLMGSFSACLAETTEQVLNAFSDYVQDSTVVDGDQKKEVQQIIDEYGAGAASDAITESLIVLHAGYGSAIEVSDEDDATATRVALQPFANSEDKYLAADASFYLGRALMNAEQFELAEPLLARVQSELADFNVHIGHARFYQGVAQAGLLNYGDAIQTLTDFIQSYPNAPERLRVAAWRQIQQLRSIKEGKLADVYQRMDFSRRKLSLIEPGERTQEQQQKIVNMLAKLIKEQEKKEASQSQSKDQKNTKQQQQNKPEQQQANKPQQQGKSQQGGTSNNANGKVVKKAYNNGPASPWSRLRDRSRDPANNAIKDKLPARYRDIVERYYEAANRDGSNQ